MLLLHPRDPLVSSEANVALLIAHHVGFMVLLEVVFRMKECFIATAFARPLARNVAGHGPVELRNV